MEWKKIEDSQLKDFIECKCEFNCDTCGSFQPCKNTQQAWIENNPPKEPTPFEEIKTEIMSWKPHERYISLAMVLIGLVLIVQFIVITVNGIQEFLALAAAKKEAAALVEKASQEDFFTSLQSELINKYIWIVFISAGFMLAVGLYKRLNNFNNYD